MKFTINNGNLNYMLKQKEDQNQSPKTKEIRLLREDK